jgi:hypothetical protein
LDPDAVDDAARGLLADAGAVRDRGNDVAGAWAGLGASYEAPEADQLLRVMDPVRSDTSNLADDLERLSGVLARFAGELREIVTKCDRLRAEVQEFRAQLAAAPIGGGADTGFGTSSGFGAVSGIRLDPVLATENALLSGPIASVTEELAEAEWACAAAIAAIDGPPQGPGGFAGFLAGAADSVAGAAEKVTNPWGEAPAPESCAGAAIAQVGTAMWTGASWAQSPPRGHTCRPFPGWPPWPWRGTPPVRNSVSP